MSPERVMFWIEIRNRLRDLHRTVGPKFVRRVRSQNPRGANAGGRLHGGHAGVGDTQWEKETDVSNETVTKDADDLMLTLD